MLSLFGGRAMAQRCLPGMSAVKVKASMVDSFYTGNSRDCGYSFGVYYSVFKGNANTWSFGGEYLQTYKPYGEKGRIPLAQFTGEVGYNLHLISDYSQTLHLYGGLSALGGYETVNWGDKILPDGSYEIQVLQFRTPGNAGDISETERQSGNADSQFQ